MTSSTTKHLRTMPAATTRIIQAEVSEINHTYHTIASMMLALREGRHFSIQPGLIQWTDEHGSQAGFSSNGSQWGPLEVCPPPPPPKQECSQRCPTTEMQSPLKTGLTIC